MIYILKELKGPFVIFYLSIFWTERKKLYFYVKKKKKKKIEIVSISICFIKKKIK